MTSLSSHPTQRGGTSFLEAAGGTKLLPPPPACEGVSMKANRVKMTLMYLCLLLIVSGSHLFAQTNKQVYSQTGVSHWQWVEEDWTGDDALYQKLRADIDRSKRNGDLTTETISKYKNIHQKKTNDPVSLFRWAYASFQATQSNPPAAQKQVVAPYDFDEAPSPHTYEYDRLRFLVWAHYNSDVHLQTVGERLLNHKPHDNDVKYYLIQCYKPWRSTLEKQKAVSLAQDLVHVAPSRPGSYSALGGVYFNSWMVSHEKEDAEKAVLAYRHYLRVAPQNYAWRRQAESIIQYITSHSATGK